MKSATTGAGADLSNAQLEMERAREEMLKDLDYVDKVIGSHGIVNGSMCHEFVKRTLEKL